jgi:hypothetical protein
MAEMMWIVQIIYPLLKVKNSRMVCQDHSLKIIFSYGDGVGGGNVDFFQFYLKLAENCIICCFFIFLEKSQKSQHSQHHLHQVS